MSQSSYPLPERSRRGLALPARLRLPGSWVRRLLLRQAMAPDITMLRRLPASTTFALRRVGIDPVPLLGETRDREPVTRLTTLFGIRVWLVTGFEEARAVLGDPHRVSNDLQRVMGERPRTGAEGVGGLGMTDPPEHDRLRALLTPEFTKHRLAALQPALDVVVDETLDDLARRGPQVDLVPGFGFAVPFRVICDLLGLSSAERVAFRDLGAGRFDVSRGGPGVFGAATTSRTFLIDAVRRQRREPGDGLIGTLLRSHGDHFDDVELGGLVDGVFLGGHETSASMLSMGAYVLMQQPSAAEVMRTGTPAAIDLVVEELLRILCPVQVAFPRFVREPFDLGGHHLASGDVVVVSLSAANRDPRTVVDPESFDASTRRGGHLAFGHGLHRCVGAELARMEMRTALTALVRRFPDLHLVPGTRPSFRELSLVHSVDALPARLTRPGAGGPSRG